MSGRDDARAVAWNEDSKVSKQLVGVGDTGDDGTRTDYDSKTVMMQAERRDNIDLEVVGLLSDEARIPNSVSVIRRSATYYGPKVVVHDEDESGEDYNYLLTAPGPDAHLLLWAAETRKDDRGRKMRRSWYTAAEVTATLAAEQPPYPECPDCGELVRTIEHERMAAIRRCDRADTWK